MATATPRTSILTWFRDRPDIRRPGEISDWIGRTIEAVILKIDEERRNIVISRRKMIEMQREERR